MWFDIDLTNCNEKTAPSVGGRDAINRWYSSKMVISSEPEELNSFEIQSKDPAVILSFALMCNAIILPAV